jgi:lipid-A-disaccharide synthase
MIFAIRYLVQWLSSERKGESVVMPLFWKLSITANLLLMLHALIQQQIHVCLVQACSSVIAWRNLNLMQPAGQHVPLGRVMWLMATVLVGVPLLFVCASMTFAIPLEWFRLPQASAQQVNNSWHLAGLCGLLMFNGRFWVQWWGAERHKQSYLGAEFWWMSVLGSVLCFVYFATIYDWINMIGPCFGLVPSIRNLVLIRRSAQSAAKSNVNGVV